jgi:ketosteroid isomerase-like protein
VIDCGEHVVMLTQQPGHGSASGAVAELEYAQVVKFRSEKVVEVDVYLDCAQALEAAGRRE